MFFFKNVAERNFDLWSEPPLALNAYNSEAILISILKLCTAPLII